MSATPTAPKERTPTQWGTSTTTTELRARLALLDAALHTNPSGVVLDALQDTRRDVCNLLSAMLLDEDDEFQELLASVLEEVHSGAPPTGLLTREQAAEMFGLS
jgi:hypothetical protein